MTDKENWNGTPPIGTHCEATWGGKSLWYECVVLPDSCLAVNFYGSWATKTALADCFQNVEFRPLKSDREREIEEMEAIMKERGCWPFRSVAEALHKAGYRKMEET